METASGAARLGNLAPRVGFHEIARHAVAKKIKGTKEKLRLRLSLRGGETVPLEGSRRILRHAEAFVIKETEAGLRLGLAGAGARRPVL